MAIDTEVLIAIFFLSCKYREDSEVVDKWIMMTFLIPYFPKLS
jgi:hypothetical protein